MPAGSQEVVRPWSECELAERVATSNEHREQSPTATAPRADHLPGTGCRRASRRSGERVAGGFRTLSLVAGVDRVGARRRRFTDAKQFFHSYLFGYVFALDIALGALFWVLIHHVSDAGWSVGLRRVFENINRAIIPLAVLFIPVLIGIFTGNLHAWYGFVHGPEPEEEHLKHLWHVKHAVLRHAVLPRAPRALLRRVDRATRSRCGTGPRGRIPSAGRPSRDEDALVGAVRRRCCSALTIHVLRVRRADEPAIHVVQHDLRRVLLGRRHPRLARDRAC